MHNWRDFAPVVFKITNRQPLLLSALGGIICRELLHPCLWCPLASPIQNQHHLAATVAREISQGTNEKNMAASFTANMSPNREDMPEILVFLDFLEHVFHAVEPISE